MARRAQQWCVHSLRAAARQAARQADQRTAARTAAAPIFAPTATCPAPLAALVDELYFEHHLRDIAFSRYRYGPKGGASLHESHELFSRLREAGMRANGWV